MIQGTLNDVGLDQYSEAIKECRRRGQNKTNIPLEHLEMLLFTAMYFKAKFESLKEDKPNE